MLGLELAREAEAHVFDSTDAATAPDLLSAEALAVIRVHERARRIDEGRSRDAAQALLDLPITRYPTLSLLERAWALRHNFGAYDAMYVALAEALETSVVTADAHLARAISVHSRAHAILLGGSRAAARP